MKISLSWLKEFVDIYEDISELGELLTQTGLEVDSIYPYESIPGSLKGLIVGKVVSVVQHPNAEKLKLTKVDVGSSQELSIVCGAPNVSEGQKVIVAPVGSTVHPLGKDPFVINKAKIRGEISEGMLCAEDEVGLGNSHEGLMILPSFYEVGKPLSFYMAAEIDSIFEIGLTPNRGDAASHLGVARDIAAKTGRKIKFPTIHELKIKIDRPIQVEVIDKQKCLRYSGLTIRGIKVASSPEWLKTRLKSIGLTPINNIVDCTNYVLHALGQPLHAFDADKIHGDKILVNTDDKETLFTTLDGKERKLNVFDLLISSQDSPLCLAGIFGGINSGVSEGTTSIFLESACFSSSAIRLSAMKHGLSTDASFRFERGTDIEITKPALLFAANLILEVAGGYIASSVVDIIPNSINKTKINLKKSTFDRLIGLHIEELEIKRILESLDFEIEEAKDSSWVVTTPSYRTEVTRPADLVEEVLRIYGINNIPLRTQNSTGFLAEFRQNEPYKLQEAVSIILAGKGFNEIITNSLTDSKYEKEIQLNLGNQVKVINPSSEELNSLKASVLYTALEVILFNINRKQTNIQFFEFGKSYKATGENYLENDTLAIYMTGNNHEAHWMQEFTPVSIQHISQLVLDLVEYLGIKQTEAVPMNENTTFSYGLEIKNDGCTIASIGKLAKNLTGYYQIDQDVYVAICDWDQWIALSRQTHQYKPMSKYPEVKRDLSLILDKSVRYDQIKKIANECAGNLLKRLNVFSIFEGEQIGSGKRAYAISYFLQDDTQTMVEKKIDDVMQKLISNYESKLGALIRK